MAFDIEPLSVNKTGDLYTAVFRAFDNADTNIGDKKFQITGTSQAEIKTKLRTKATKMKTIHDTQYTWFSLAENIIQDLRDEGIF